MLSATALVPDTNADSCVEASPAWPCFQTVELRRDRDNHKSFSIDGERTYRLPNNLRRSCEGPPYQNTPVVRARNSRLPITAECDGIQSQPVWLSRDKRFAKGGSEYQIAFPYGNCAVLADRCDAPKLATLSLRRVPHELGASQSSSCRSPHGPRPTVHRTFLRGPSAQMNARAAHSHIRQVGGSEPTCGVAHLRKRANHRDRASPGT